MAIIASLLITLEDNGQVKVEGCIEQRLMAYGLLETARDVVLSHVTAQEKLVKPASDMEAAALRSHLHSVPKS